MAYIGPDSVHHRWVLHRLEQRRFAFNFDELYFIVQRERREWEINWTGHNPYQELFVDVSKPYSRKEDVTKKLFQLWKDAEEGRGDYLDMEGSPLYRVAIYDHDPRDDGVYVGNIGSLLWAQLVSRLLNKKEVDRMIKT